MSKDVLTDKVYNFTGEESLFSAPCHVLVGVSGGADSMSLLHILQNWPVGGLRITVVHINHGIRGAYAERDEHFVRGYCMEHNLPFVAISEDVPAMANEQGLSVEEAGRIVRYEVFEKVRVFVGADYILTAHTADDQAETVLMRMIRGSGVDGLSGIAKKRGAIRRPLLSCTRAEIEAYCERNGVCYVTDETNMYTRYFRNDVRLRVLPLLKEMNPSVVDALQRLSDCATMDADYLNELAKSALDSAYNGQGYAADVLSAQPEAIRRRAIRLMLRRIPLSVVEESYISAVDSMLLSNRGSVCVAGGYLLAVEQGIVYVQKQGRLDVPDELMIDIIPGKVCFGAFECTLTVHSTDDENIHNLLVQSAIDYDKIVGKLCLRARRSGDYFHPCGRGVGKSIKKLMNEWRIPAHLRDVYPLLCDDEGVVWIPGYACDERVRITQNTNHYLVCKVEAVQG